MDQPDSKQLATENLRKTLEFLSDHQLFPTALNYAVGYEYVTGMHPANREIIENCLTENSGLSDSLIQGLFEQIFFRDYEDRLGIHSELELVLRHMMEAMSVADSGLSEYGATLNIHMDSLSNQSNTGEVEAILKDLIAATEGVNRSNQSLQESLRTAQEEGDHLREELERARAEAITDALTGLLNRNAMDQELPRLIEHAKDNQENLCILMLDIDHFKAFNDNFGHQVGDHVLQHVAAAIKKIIRGSDYAIRFGGEEFLVLLPDTPNKGAMTVANSMRTTIESLRLIKIRTQEKLPCTTVSIGVACWEHDEAPETLISRVDQALYEAKSCGRNCVVGSA